MSIKSARCQNNLRRVLLFIFIFDSRANGMCRLWSVYSVVTPMWIEQSGLFLNHFISFHCSKAPNTREKKLVPNKGNASVWMCADTSGHQYCHRPVRIVSRKCCSSTRRLYCKAIDTMFHVWISPDTRCVCVQIVGNRCFAEIFHAKKKTFSQINLGEWWLRERYPVRCIRCWHGRFAINSNENKSATTASGRHTFAPWHFRVQPIGRDIIIKAMWHKSKHRVLSSVKRDATGGYAARSNSISSGYN